MGISIRAYARHRGVSASAVTKAIQSGRITPESDGTLDANKIDKQWAENTNPAREQSQNKETSLNEVKEVQTYAQAKAANEALKVELTRLKLRKEKNELIDKAKALQHVFGLARATRDAWLNWPARISAQMASELKINPDELYRVLESYVREHLHEVAKVKPKFE